MTGAGRGLQPSRAAQRGLRRDFPVVADLDFQTGLSGQRRRSQACTALWDSAYREGEDG